MRQTEQRGVARVIELASINVRSVDVAKWDLVRIEATRRRLTIGAVLGQIIEEWRKTNEHTT